MGELLFKTGPELLKTGPGSKLLLMRNLQCFLLNFHGGSLEGPFFLGGGCSWILSQGGGGAIGQKGGWGVLEAKNRKGGAYTASHFAKGGALRVHPPCPCLVCHNR